MNRAFYLQTSQVEEEHWWFRHRRALVAMLLERFTAGRPMQSGLDLGCGTGGNLPLLERFCAEAVGLDRAEYALELARAKRPGARLVQGDANRLNESFEPESFDLVTVFNVLYHRWIEYEGEVLEQVGRLLRPGGLLVLTEPAFPALFRRHDVVDFGARRYRRAELRGMVESAGLRVRSATWFNVPGLVPAWVRARWDRLSGALERLVEDDEEVGELALPRRWLNRSLYAALGAERAWIRYLGGPPAGLTLLLVAFKPERK